GLPARVARPPSDRGRTGADARTRALGPDADRPDDRLDEAGTVTGIDGHASPGRRAGRSPRPRHDQASDARNGRLEVTVNEYAGDRAADTFSDSRRVVG